MVFSTNVSSTYTFYETNTHRIPKSIPSGCIWIFGANLHFRKVEMWRLLTTVEYREVLFLTWSKWKCGVYLTRKLAEFVVVTRQLISFQAPFVLHRYTLEMDGNEGRLVLNLSLPSLCKLSRYFVSSATVYFIKSVLFCLENSEILCWLNGEVAKIYVIDKFYQKYYWLMIPNATLEILLLLMLVWVRAGYK